MKVFTDLRAHVALFCTLLLVGMMAAPASAQYGTGEEIEVPRVSAGTITVDGVMDEPIWDVAPTVDLLNFSNFFTEEIPSPDVAAEGRMVYTEDTLYVFVQVLDNEFFVSPDEPFESDQILIGVDGTHAGDDQTDEGFGGWSANAPDLGPTTYKIWLEGITLNWGFDDIDPVAEGWVNGTVYMDEETLEWGVEVAIFVPQIEPGAQIGFNIGGAQASADPGFAYGFYSWQAIENASAGGDVMSNAASFATLTMEERQTGGDYGIGVDVNVPPAEGEMVMDGVDDEAAWEGAPEFDLLAFSNFFTEEIPEPDLAASGKALYTQDTLYVFVRVLDNEFFSSSEEPFESDQILIGVDGTHAGDDQVDDGFAGWPDNAPDLGPTTYKIWHEGITINWGFDDIDPVAEGWVNGTVFQDAEALEWGVEVAIYVPQIEPGAEIGFNIGGAQASEGMGFAYGFYSWQATEDASAGGDVMRDASTFATLNLIEPVGVEERSRDEIPLSFTLSQNFPNPFNPSTTIEYAMAQRGHASLTVHDVLGQSVAVLVDGVRAAGTYQVSWDAINLPSGVYVYQLRVDGRVVSAKKMMLLK